VQQRFLPATSTLATIPVPTMPTVLSFHQSSLTPGCVCPHRCLYLCLYLRRCLRVRTVGEGAEAKIEITLKERLQGYFYSTHRITDTFLSTPLQNMEREWIRVMGSLSEPLTAQSMAQFLTFVLVDHPNPINKYNCKELCSLFDKRLDAQV